MILKLLSYNIRHGGRGREQYLISVIRNAAPDVVVFQEAVDTRVIEHLAKETGMRYSDSRTGHSLGFMSRLDIADRKWHRPRGARHSFLEISLKGNEFKIIGVHLSAIHSKWTERRRIREVRALLARIEGRLDGFHALVGDFNTLAPGELLEVKLLPPRLRPLVWLTGKIKWQTIKILLEAKYEDGYRFLHPDEKGFTFPTWAPHLRLDYVFVPKGHAERLKSCEVIQGTDEASQASDHFPVLAHLEIPDL